jgi:hypothetical protein
MIEHGNSGADLDVSRVTAHALLHECERNTRYHTARRAFLDRCHRVMMTLVLVSGSSAVAAIFGAFGADETFSGAVAAVPPLMGAIAIVWNLASRARDHQVLASRFYYVARAITAGPATPENAARWQAELLEVYESEPGTFHALNAECYNAATRAMNRQPRPLYRIRWHQHILRNWWPFSPGSFELRDPDPATWPAAHSAA